MRLASCQPFVLAGRLDPRGLPGARVRGGALRMMASAVAPAKQDTAGLIASLNEQYEQVHKAFEDQFWSSKMGLKGASSDSLARSKTDYETFLADEQRLRATQEALKGEDVTPEQKHILKIIEKTFRVNQIEPQALPLKEQLNKLEAELGEHRGKMALGFTPPGGEFQKASSVQIANKIRTDPDEGIRQAAWEGLRSVGPHVVEKLCEVVKLRNKLAKANGFEDFYAYKLMGAEGMTKETLFGIMDGLEKDSRPIMEAARASIAKEKGDAALEPWSLSYSIAGDTEKALDPYFAFENAVDVWARTFAGLGIKYNDAVMRLDLCDREGKYSNGFCHWPQPAWRKPDGTWVPSQANFTSLATPDAIGSGKTALMTLLHEGGHAAHFANVDQGSPFFCQERAPFSVATAENQSMFLDSLMGDAEWLSRYSRDREGNPIPWDLVEQSIRASHPYEVFMLRSMLAVPYFEKALYELPDEEVTPENVSRLADETEVKIQGALAGRPLLAVPHILADESSAYYHGYVLAEMSVHQTRAYFLKTLGQIVDKEEVGKKLAEVYWKPGNGVQFLDLVENMTGAPLTGEAWVAALREPLEDKVASEKQAFEAGLKVGPKIPPGQEPDLGMKILLVHGDEVVADSSQEGGLSGACATYKNWLSNTFPG
mmetsp:Transcript_12072/g.36231  ORF Transcript_12072/g.36231 Transcript_12072/m.36231 type:complete len:656 (-) Transcript_12072:500-2467(-)